MSLEKLGSMMPRGVYRIQPPKPPEPKPKRPSVIAGFLVRHQDAFAGIGLLLSIVVVTCSIVFSIMTVGEAFNTRRACEDFANTSRNELPARCIHYWETHP